MQNQKQIRFKTAAGWLGYHSGMPEPSDPGMTEEEHAEWQKEVFLDALTPEDEGPCSECGADLDQDEPHYYICSQSER